MSLRPIKPMSFPESKPAALNEGAEPEVFWVSPHSLVVDEAYQRGLSKQSVTLIRKIVTTWSWTKFKPPIVVKVGESWRVIDGQHTAIGAASHGGIPAIPVICVQADTVEEQADAFLGHNRDRLAVSTLQMHHAAVAKRDADALAVEALAAAAGVRILRSVRAKEECKPCDTIAITDLYRLVRRHGHDGGLAILQTLADAGLAPIGSTHIWAAELLLTDPEYAGKVTCAAVTSALLSMGYLADQEAKVFAATHSVRLYRGLAAVIFRRAKRGRRAA